MRNVSGWCAILVFGLACVGARADDSTPRFLFTADHALVLAERELVSTGQALRVEWSPDSRFVVAVRRTVKLKNPELLPLASSLPDVAGETSIVLLDRQKHRPVTVWRQPSARAQVTLVRWLAGEPTAIIGVEGPPSEASPSPRTIALRLDAVRATCTPMAEVGPLANFTFSPSRSVASVIDAAPSGTRTWMILPGGQVKAAALPGSTGYPRTQWSPDGRLLYVGLAERPVEPGKPQPAAWFSVDPAQGSFARISGPSDAVALPPDPPVQPNTRLQTESLRLSRPGTTATVNPLWLETTEVSERPRMLVCADAAEAELSPDGSGIAYITDDAAWVASLVKRPKESVLAVLETMEARACRANMAAIASAESAFATRFGAYTATPMLDYNRDNPAAGGLIGAPEGLSATVDCPSGGSYLFSIQDGAFTVACPHGDHHATRAGKPEDYRRTLQSPK